MLSSTIKLLKTVMRKKKKKFSGANMTAIFTIIIHPNYFSIFML